MTRQQSDKTKKQGFVTLFSVRLLGLIAVELATALLFFGADASRSSISIEESNNAKALTNACTEEALQQLKNSPSFSGNGSLTFTVGTCSYTVSGSGPNRTIIASSTVGASVRKTSIATDQITPKIHVSSWQEVAN